MFELLSRLKKTSASETSPPTSPEVTSNHLSRSWWQEILAQTDIPRRAFLKYAVLLAGVLTGAPTLREADASSGDPHTEPSTYSERKGRLTTMTDAEVLNQPHKLLESIVHHLSRPDRQANNTVTDRAFIEYFSPENPIGRVRLTMLETFFSLPPEGASYGQKLYALITESYRTWHLPQPDLMAWVTPLYLSLIGLNYFFSADDVHQGNIPEYVFTDLRNLVDYIQPFTEGPLNNYSLEKQRYFQKGEELLNKDYRLENNLERLWTTLLKLHAPVPPHLEQVTVNDYRIFETLRRFHQEFFPLAELGLDHIDAPFRNRGYYWSTHGTSVIALDNSFRETVSAQEQSLVHPEDFLATSNFDFWVNTLMSMYVHEFAHHWEVDHSGVEIRHIHPTDLFGHVEHYQQFFKNIMTNLGHMYASDVIMYWTDSLTPKSFGTDEIVDDSAKKAVDDELDQLIEAQRFLETTMSSLNLPQQVNLHQLFDGSSSEFAFWTTTTNLELLNDLGYPHVDAYFSDATELLPQLGALNKLSSLQLLKVKAILQKAWKGEYKDSSESYLRFVVYIKEFYTWALGVTFINLVNWHHELTLSQVTPLSTDQLEKLSVHADTIGKRVTSHFMHCTIGPAKQYMNLAGYPAEMIYSQHDQIEAALVHSKDVRQRQQDAVTAYNELHPEHLLTWPTNDQQITFYEQLNRDVYELFTERLKIYGTDVALFRMPNKAIQDQLAARGGVGTLAGLELAFSLFANQFVSELDPQVG